ncbi:MAG: hypothetical protein RR280_08705 [Bacteroidaceae bacterium]
MKEYILAVYDHKGIRLGTVNFGKRPTEPTENEVLLEIRECFPKRVSSYKFID